MDFIFEQEINRRFAYVVLRLNSIESDKEVILKVSKKIEDTKPPSRQTLRRWVIIFNESRNDKYSLNPKHYLKGNRNIKLAGANKKNRNKSIVQKAFKLNSIIDQMIEEDYNHFNISIRLLYLLIKHKIEETNKHLSQKKQLPIPHLNTIYKRINKDEDKPFNKLFSTFFGGEAKVPRIPISSYLLNKHNLLIQDDTPKIQDDIYPEIQNNLIPKSVVKALCQVQKKSNFIAKLLRNKFECEQKVFLHKHKTLISEKRKGVVNRSIFEIGEIYCRILKKFVQNNTPV